MAQRPLYRQLVRMSQNTEHEEWVTPQQGQHAQNTVTKQERNPNYKLQNRPQDLLPKTGVRRGINNFLAELSKCVNRRLGGGGHQD